MTLLRTCLSRAAAAFLISLAGGLAAAQTQDPIADLLDTPPAPAPADPAIAPSTAQPQTQKAPAQPAPDAPVATAPAPSGTAGASPAPAAQVSVSIQPPAAVAIAPAAVQAPLAEEVPQSPLVATPQPPPPAQSAVVTSPAPPLPVQARPAQPDLPPAAPPAASAVLAPSPAPAAQAQPVQASIPQRFAAPPPTADEDEDADQPPPQAAPEQASVTQPYLPSSPQPYVPSPAYMPFSRIPRQQARVTTPVHIDEMGRSPEAPPNTRDLYYEQRLRESFAVAQGLQGPLDGGWTLSSEPGGDLYSLELVDRSGRSLEGAWRDLHRLGAIGASGFFDEIQRYGSLLTLRFSPRAGAPQAVATLSPRADGRWTGELVNGSERRSVAPRRN